MNLFNRLLNLLDPPKCAFCRRLVPGERMLCEECEKNLPMVPVGRRRRELPPLDGCYSPLYYKDSVRLSLHRYKFHGAAAYHRIYAELMFLCLDGTDPAIDFISWIPLSRKRRRKRGYDQAQLLAQELSRLAGIPCRQLLLKTRNNRAQSGTASAAERARNVQGVYRSVEALENSRILLIDDIVTTGSTMRAAAEVLLSAGAASVTGMTLARDPFGEDDIPAADMKNREKATERNGDNNYADL